MDTAGYVVYISFFGEIAKTFLYDETQTGDHDVLAHGTLWPQVPFIQNATITYKPVQIF